MINKEEYFAEVDELVSKNKSLDKVDFEILYEVLEGKKYTIDATFLADKIVKNLSGNMFTQTMISWEFLDSEIGRALIKAKFDVGSKIYFTSDVAELMGCSRQFISKEMGDENINYHQRGGIKYFMEKDVKEYMTKKNKLPLQEKQESTYEEIREKIISGEYERESEYKTN